METTNKYRDLILQDIPMIDVRAEVEFEKGAFLNSVNLPILDTEQRHIIGTCYKEHGNETATKLGYEMISGELRENRIKGWVDFIKKNPNAAIYCFRGGSRSTIAQGWINEATGGSIVKVEGGYKAMRNYLIEALVPENIRSTPLVLSGCTGSGKTDLLNEFDYAVDLEGVANHRGSAFGNNITPQPTQISFENNLATAIIKHDYKEYKYMLLEDESKNIGRNYMPKELFMHFRTGDVVMVEVPMEKRIENILKDYVHRPQEQYAIVCGEGENSLEVWYNKIITNVNKVQGKLGGDRHKLVLDQVNFAYDKQLATGETKYHSTWIESLLNYYYDPMYLYSIEKSNRDIIFRGSTEEVREYLSQIK